MFIVYNIIFFIFAIFSIPFLLLKRKWHKGMKSRFGYLDQEVVDEIQDSKVIWIHAVSVGEVLAVSNLVDRLKKKFSDHTIVFSTVTKTGFQVAKETLNDVVVIFAPLDFSWVVKKYIRIIKPVLYVAMETEVWPNLYSALKRNGVPIFLVNGRISDDSFKGYQKIRFLTKGVFGKIDCMCMQSEEDKERIINLGAKEARVHVLGNLKFDGISLNGKSSKLLKKASSPVWVAGSTHPGEEEIVFLTYQKLLSNFKDLRLILAPRHIERAEDIYLSAKALGFNVKKYSEQVDIQKANFQILIVDEVGHLRHLYESADVVFIGKTFKVGGGQNMIEPASLGKTTIVGPLTYNFKDVVKILLKGKAIIQIINEQDLYSEIKKLLNDPDESQHMGQRAQILIQKYKGATLKTANLIEQYLIGVSRQ